MLSKCVNPMCSTPFRYLREGKIILAASPARVEERRHPVEHFWLCGPCSQEYELTTKQQGGVALVPKQKRWPNVRRRATLTTGAMQTSPYPENHKFSVAHA